MNLVSVANKFYRQIKIASNNNYKNLLRVHELAQAAAIDPYSDYSPQEQKDLQNLLRTISILTDKAYRTGVDASNVKMFLDKAKGQVQKILAATHTPAIKNDLGKLMTALESVQTIDIPSQMAGNTSEMVMPEDKVTSIPTTSAQPKGGLTPEMGRVVEDLVRKNYPTVEDSQWP